MKIQWFAGHMARTKRIIKAKLKLIDVVLELVDARIPLSSRSPLIADILRGKPSLLILNKADLADRALTGLWVKWFRSQGVTAIPFDSVRGQGKEKIFKEVFRLAFGKDPGQKAGGSESSLKRFPTSSLRPPTAIVVGIPNVGKSMFINRLAGRRAARTGQLPGLTRGEQWIKIEGKMELLDTPGVLWPKLEDREAAIKLAATGAVKEDLFDVRQVADWVLNWLLENKRKELLKHYGLTENPPEDEFLLEAIGRKRGFLVSGGAADLHKTSVHILSEFRAGKLGRYTLESSPG